MDENSPATKKDIQELGEKIAGLDEKIVGLDEKIRGFQDIVAELVRDAQTEILRGFDHFQAGLILRVRKAESDLSNINASNIATVGKPGRAHA